MYKARPTFAWRVHVIVTKSCWIPFQAEELRILREKTPEGLWLEDLDHFLEELEVSVCMCPAPGFCTLANKGMIGVCYLFLLLIFKSNISSSSNNKNNNKNKER